MKEEEKMIWSSLIHLGMNFWGDIERPACPFRWMETPEAAECVRTTYKAADHLRFDEAFWRNLVVPSMKAGGVNMIVFDLGEGVVYPSHPELAVEGSWSPEKLRAELDRLRGMGFEMVPKLNFSASHDIWLKDYHRMISTPEYYRVCADLIRDAIEIFDHPRFVHLGLDEETPTFQRWHTFAAVRQGDLWWHDILLLIREVEKHDARAWIWSDYIRRHPLAEFERRMPKSVVQCPWTYTYTHFQQAAVETDPSENKNMEVMVKLLGAGYDVIPCGSNCYGCKTNLEDLVRFFSRRPESDRKHVLGFLHAPWLMMRPCFERRFRELGEQVANGIAIWNGTDPQLPFKGKCGTTGPEVFTIDAVADGFDARFDALPRKGAWIVVACPDESAVQVAKRIAARERLYQTVLVAGPAALRAAKAAVPALLTGRKDAVRNDGELHEAIYADYRLVRLAKDAELTSDKVNHFRGWRGLTVGAHSESDFKE